jgi:hypothetical protein
MRPSDDEQLAQRAPVAVHIPGSVEVRWCSRKQPATNRLENFSELGRREAYVAPQRLQGGTHEECISHAAIQAFQDDC